MVVLVSFFWYCMAGKWYPMQFGGPRWSLGAARGLPGGYRIQNEGFRKFGKRCFLTPGGKRGVWEGSSLHYCVETNPKRVLVKQKNVLG